jgi:hypothetical protein
MAQDPEELDDKPDPVEVNLSHDLDTVSFFQSQTVDAELDADNIHGVLESSGISSVVRRTPYPTLGVEVLVARADLERSQALVAEALAAGPDAAAEAEAASEEPQ